MMGGAWMVGNSGDERRVTRLSSSRVTRLALTVLRGAGNFRPQTPTLGSSEVMPYIIAEPCINVKDRGCVDVCPVDCIYEGDDHLYIHPDECIDCGACEPECP